MGLLVYWAGFRNGFFSPEIGKEEDGYCTCQFEELFFFVGMG